ncbi:MAG TPA: MerR family transcriptional regulator [Firmicutes bacterium]|nr:MerR family transcriptional regulator [Bacillota bacterium]
MDKTEAVYTIGTVLRLTGLTARQVRYWEKKGLLAPKRTPGGHRVYSQAQVDLLNRIGELVEKGYRLEEVKRRLFTASETGQVVESDAAIRFGEKPGFRGLYYGYKGER